MGKQAKNTRGVLIIQRAGHIVRFHHVLHPKWMVPRYKACTTVFSYILDIADK